MRRFLPSAQRTLTAAGTIPPAGGTIRVSPCPLPGVGAREEGGVFNGMGPELTIAVAIEPNAAGLFAAAPTCSVSLNLIAAETQQLTQPLIVSAAATGHLFRLPVPPQGSISATLTAGATTTGNPEIVFVHYNVYVLPTEICYVRAGDLLASSQRQTDRREQWEIARQTRITETP